MPYRSVCAPQYLSAGTYNCEHDVYDQLGLSNIPESPQRHRSRFLFVKTIASYPLVAGFTFAQQLKDAQLRTILEVVDNNLELARGLLLGC